MGGISKSCLDEDGIVDKAAEKDAQTPQKAINLKPL